jgi:hypothetical protein
MKFFLIIGILFFSCSNKIDLSYDGVNFGYPITIKQLNQNVELKYFPYEGIKGQSSNYRIEIQLKGLSDNWWDCDWCDIQDYRDEEIKGIIFYQKNGNIDALKNKLEDQYKSHWREIVRDSMMVSLLSLNNQTSIVLFKKQENLCVAFYYKVNENEIMGYVKGVKARR